MDTFSKYRRKQIAELRPVSVEEASTKVLPEGVSVSKYDADNGSPKLGDMIARNPDEHSDQWLVAEKYFNDNFEAIKD